MNVNHLSWYDHKIVIKRRIWRCGKSGKHRHGELQTKLLDSDGMMCCLGQDAEACGIDREKLFDREDPNEIDQVFGRLSKKISHLIHDSTNSKFANDMIKVNDDPYLTDARRELELFLVGKKHRVFIQFVGEYDPNPNCVAPEKPL